MKSNSIEDGQNGTTRHNIRGDHVESIPSIRSSVRRVESLCSAESGETRNTIATSPNKKGMKDSFGKPPSQYTEYDPNRFKDALSRIKNEVGYQGGRDPPTKKTKSEGHGKLSVLTLKFPESSIHFDCSKKHNHHRETEVV